MGAAAARSCTGQGFDEAADLDPHVGFPGDVVAEQAAGGGLTIDVELAGLHLDAIAGQADDALDVVGGIVAGELEDGDVAALGQGGEDAAGEQVWREGQRVPRVAVAVFGNKEVVADQQGWFHRAGGDVERLEGDGADADGDQAGIDDGLDVFDERAG